MVSSGLSRAEVGRLRVGSSAPIILFEGGEAFFALQAPKVVERFGNCDAIDPSGEF